jgi:hypothetical protein
MAEQAEQKPGFWTNFSSTDGRVGIVALILVLILGIVLFGFSWNTRYNAGYRVGAGEGAVYKELYHQAQKDIGTLQRQHETDIKEITRLTKAASTKRGRLKPAQIDADKLKEQAERELAEIQVQRNAILEQSIEIGKQVGRAEEAEKQSQALQAQLHASENRFNLSLIGNVILAIGLLTTLGVGFLEKQGVIQSRDSRAFYRDPKTISVKSMESTSDGKSLQEAEAFDQKALPSEPSEDE